MIRLSHTLYYSIRISPLLCTPLVTFRNSTLYDVFAHLYTIENYIFLLGELVRFWLNFLKPLIGRCLFNYLTDSLTHST
jgi:hypothetical protein